MAAARAHDAPLVRSMLERHSGLASFHDPNGQTPLLAAIDDALLPCDAPSKEGLDGQRRIDTVTALCEHDVLANVVDTSTEFTPLCLASVKGFIGVIEVLLSLGADIHLRISSDHPTFGGWTALHFAAHAGHGGVCAGLVHMGADGTARTSALPRGSRGSRGAVHLAHTAHMPGLQLPRRPGGYTPLLVAASGLADVIACRVIQRILREKERECVRDASACIRRHQAFALARIHISNSGFLSEMASYDVASNI